MGSQPPPPPPPPPTATTFNLSAANAPNGSWVFAEGAIGLAGKFSTYYAISNPNASDVQVRAYYIRENGASPVITSRTFTVASRSRMTIDLADATNGAGAVPGSYSAVFQSQGTGLQVYISRTMYWGGTAGVLTGPGHLKMGLYVPPNGSLPTSSYFAEGARVYRSGRQIENYFMFFNPNAADTTVWVDFLSDTGAGLIKRVAQVVPARGRWTLDAASYPELSGKSFSTRVISDPGVVAERSMYWGANWSAGHTDFAGVPARDWYFAEGTAQNWFDTYFLLLNPTASTVSVTVTYQFAGRPSVDQVLTIKPNTRETIYLNGAVGNQPGATADFHASDTIVVERSMYWGADWSPWTEGSTALGSPQAATEWHLSEGSTASGFETYLLLSNPNLYDINVVVTTFSADGWQETNLVAVSAKSRKTVLMNTNPGWPTIQGKAFSIRCTATAPFVAEESVYWQPLSTGYWRGGDATMGFPIIR